VVKQIGVIIEPNDEINIAIDSALALGNGSKDPWVSRVELTSQAPDLSAVRPVTALRLIGLAGFRL
jgi:hypothetical protein